MTELKYEIAVKVDGKKHVFTDPVITGRQILTAAGLHPAEDHLVYQRLKEGQFEEIRLEESVDISRPGLERFKTFRSGESYRFVIEGRRFEWGAPEITGLMLKKFAGAESTNVDVWLEVRGPGDDVLILDHESVRLDEPGVEKFYIAALSIELIINGRPRVVNQRTLSFSEIVKIAFPDVQDAPNTIYTIVYKNGPDENPQGSLVEGETINVQNRMIINVTKTDKS